MLIQYKEILYLIMQWTVAGDIEEDASEDLSMFTTWTPEVHQRCEHVFNNVRDALSPEKWGILELTEPR